MQHIGKTKDALIENLKKGDIQLCAKLSVNVSKNKVLDDAVYLWFCETRNSKFRCKPLFISRAHIQARALREANLLGLSNFRASDGWFRNWRNRLAEGESIRLYGEAGDVNISDIAPMMRELRMFLVVYDPANIFNMDESGLFYRAMPARTYLAANESRRTVRGTKALKAKDRVTVVFCCNATGKNTGTLGYQLFVFGNIYKFLRSV